MRTSTNTLKAVLLDAGNTILGLDYQLLAQTLAPGNPAVTPEALARAEARARKLLAPFFVSENPPSLEEGITLFARAMAEPFGIGPEEPGPRRLVELFMSSEGMDRAWSVPIPGAKEALEALRNRGLRLAVVSNGDGQAPRRLREAGMAEYFEEIIDSGNVGVEKPDPRIFLLTLEKLGVEPSRAVHVGDFYQVDVLGARKAGLKEGILIDPYGDWEDTDCPRIPSVAQLPAFLDTLA